MMSALATAVADHTVVRGGWWWPGPWFLLFPLFWILVVVAVIAFVGSRRRRWLAAGYGPCGEGSVRSATSVLAERYARGEIDEAEYRARLETLLATERRPGT